jgi:hypothetical protein
MPALPEPTDHRVGCLALEEERDDLVGLALTTP